VRARPEFPGPCWNGESLAGRTIALHAEQGYGDTFQFVRYASLVARAAGKTVLQVPASVADLVQGLPGVRVVVQGEPLPRFDFHCPLMSLPRAFGTRLETIPADVPYLRAPAERITKWARRLGGKTARRIGLVWSGRPEQQNDRNRSVGVAGLLPLLEAWGCAFYGLQKAASGPLPGGLTHLGGEFEDFADTAAVISLMDLVISVDTSVAHLAGAMGAPVWLLLPYAADWRWLQDRSDSPWYPTARLFRQARPGDWESVTREVLEALGIR
jgi:hypothetical protein